jgi:Flp pilus assembly protein TadD
MNKKFIYIIIVLLTVTCLAAFGRIAGNDFINFDDDLYITANHYVQSGFNYQTIKWALEAVVVSNWHPLTILSHMLDWSLFGDNAAGHHLVSLLLHIGTVIFLFLFLFKTTNNLWPAAFAAAFFALHPLRVESVAWASERKDVLSMFFGMATIYAYAFYTTSSKISKYLLCLALFALSLMSKPMLVTLPFVLLLLDYWPLKRLSFSDSSEINLKAAGRLVGEKIPFFILTITSSLATIWAQNKGGALVNVQTIPFAERFFNAIVSYTAYLGKTFWPFNLSVFYPFEFSLPLWKVLFSASIFLFITAAALYYIKKLPFLFTGWFFYLGTLIPVIGLVQVGEQAMADRYTYLPSIGIVIVITWGISSLITGEKIRRYFLFPAAISILAVLTVLTFSQCGYWKNSIVLFRQALHVTRNNYKMNHNLGTSYFKEGKIKEAFYHFNKAVTIRPNYISFNSRGEIYARSGLYRQALDDFNNAVKLNKAFAESYYNRGLTYDKIGESELAIADFDRAIFLKRDYTDAFNNRGIVYAKTGQHQKALEDFTKAISIKPDYAQAYSNRSITYFSRGENVPGCQDARKACELGNCKTLQDAGVKGLCR